MENGDGQQVPTVGWEAWCLAEVAGRWFLHGTQLPAADQEVLLSDGLVQLLREWQRGRPVKHPAAWIRTVLRRLVWDARRDGLALELSHDPASSTGSETGLRELLGDPWARVEPHEGRLLGRLSEAERRVYEAVKRGGPLRQCARELGMSPRDVRVRLSRVCQKLDGILAHLVPPPCTPGTASRRLRRRRLRPVRQSVRSNH